MMSVFSIGPLDDLWSRLMLEIPGISGIVPQWGGSPAPESPNNIFGKGYVPCTGR